MPRRKPERPEQLDSHEQTVLSEATAPNRSPDPEVEEKVERLAEGEHPLDADRDRDPPLPQRQQ
ncbi:MAG TPA: hypothetical protein VK911_16795 [Vicinamibacterales bacterium]|nr:hypothetical protein [Vicinamibacterales bacterium]